MKGRIFIYLLCVTLAFSACKKDDAPAFDESADERLNKALTSYQDKLVGADNGWKAFISPKGGGTYFFYFKFNAPVLRTCVQCAEKNFRIWNFIFG